MLTQTAEPPNRDFAGARGRPRSSGAGEGAPASLAEPSVHDRVVEEIVGVIQMRNLQRPHRGNRRPQRIVCAAALADRPSLRPQRPQDLSPIEALPFTVFTKTHRVRCLG
jgi:hypothetical protein